MSGTWFKYGLWYSVNQELSWNTLLLIRYFQGFWPVMPDHFRYQNLLLLEIGISLSVPAYELRPPFDPNSYQLLPLTPDFRSQWKPAFLFLSPSEFWNSIWNTLDFREYSYLISGRSLKFFHCENSTEAFPDQKALLRSSSASDLVHFTLDKDVDDRISSWSLIFTVPEIPANSNSHVLDLSDSNFLSPAEILNIAPSSDWCSWNNICHRIC